MMNSVQELCNSIIEKKKIYDGDRLFTVAISGIDASGKGYITKLLQQELESRGYKVANINIDPWQNSLPIRLRKKNAAENVYENIFRWNDFFEQLIFPFQKNKAIYLETKGIRSDADVYYPLVYDYKETDILLIEGILLFKKEYFLYYHYRIWIECSFETGIKRAIRRNTENLSEERLILDYQTFYYPAQLLHFDKDNPRQVADIVFNNY